MLSRRESAVVPTLSGQAAPLWRRCLGFILDAVLADVLIIPLALLLGHRWVAVLLAVTISTAYFVPLTATLGRTVGSSVVKVRLVGPGGGIPGWRRAIIRWGLLLVPLVIAQQMNQMAIWIVFVVLYGPAVFDSRRRSIPDRVSGVMAVQSEPS